MSNQLVKTVCLLSSNLKIVLHHSSSSPFPGTQSKQLTVSNIVLEIRHFYHANLSSRDLIVIHQSSVGRRLCGRALQFGTDSYTIGQSHHVCVTDILIFSSHAGRGLLSDKALILIT